MMSCAQVATCFRRNCTITSIFKVRRIVMKTISAYTEMECVCPQIPQITLFVAWRQVLALTAIYNMHYLCETDTLRIQELGYRICSKLPINPVPSQIIINTKFPFEHRGFAINPVLLVKYSFVKQASLQLY